MASKVKRDYFKLNCCLLGWTLSCSSIAAEVKVEPAVSATYSYIDEAKIGQFNVDGHNAALIVPSVKITASSPKWQGALSAEHTDIQQIESGYDDDSYTNLSINNSFNFWQGRLAITANGSKNYQNIDSEFDAVSDPVFGLAEYVDIDAVSTSLSLSTSSRSKWRTSLNVKYSETKFDEEDLIDTEATSTRILPSENKGASVTLGYGELGSKTRGQLTISGNRVSRENRGDQDAINTSILLGFPISSSVDFVINGSKVENKLDNSAVNNSDIESESYGAGLAWRIGGRSFLQVSQNKSTRGQEEEFVSYTARIQPNRRTNFRFQQSRRFYGESNLVNFEHLGKKWNLSLTYDVALESRTRLQRTEVGRRPFLCEVGAASQADCESISVAPDVLQPGQFVIEATELAFTLDEDVVVRKSLSSNISYQFKKAQLSLAYGRSESDYLERDELRDTETMSLNYTHQMNRRNKLLFSGNKTRSKTDLRQEYRTGYKLGLEFERRLTRKATGRIGLKKIENESNTGQQDRQDSRLEVTYKYSF